MHGEAPYYRVVSAAFPTNAPCMRVGWRTTEEGLILPKARFSCDVLHLAGVIPPCIELCAAAVAEACGEVGAKAIFWEPQAPAAHAAALVGLWRERWGLRLYSPLALSGTIPVCEDVPASVPTRPFAVGISARMTLTEIRDGHAVKRTVTHDELSALIAQHHPTIACSAELTADFFTLSQGDSTIFAVFDTEATLQKRIARAADTGASAVFCDFCEKS